MTAVQVEKVQRGTCRSCGQPIPLRPDGLISWHYQRYGTQQPRRRKRCPGSHHLPRQEQP